MHFKIYCLDKNNEFFKHCLSHLSVSCTSLHNILPSYRNVSNYFLLFQHCTVYVQTLFSHSPSVVVLPSHRTPAYCVRIACYHRLSSFLQTLFTKTLFLYHRFITNPVYSNNQTKDKTFFITFLFFMSRSLCRLSSF